MTDFLRLAQRHNGCRETGRACGAPPACGCALEAAVEREDEGMTEAGQLYAFAVLSAPACEAPHEVEFVSMNHLKAEAERNRLAQDNRSRKFVVCKVSVKELVGT